MYSLAPFTWHCRLARVLSPCPPGSQGCQWALCLAGWHLSALSKSQGHNACWTLDLGHIVASCSLLPGGRYSHQLSSLPWGERVPVPSAGAVIMEGAGPSTLCLLPTQNPR